MLNSRLSRGKTFTRSGDTRLATDGRRLQPDHTPGNRGAWLDVRDRVNGPDRLATSRLRRTPRRLRPDHDVSVPE